MKDQTHKDRMHESKAMKHYEHSYSSKMAKAGHRYDESAKHHRRESEGMKKAMHHKYPGSEEHGAHHPHKAHNPGY